MNWGPVIIWFGTGVVAGAAVILTELIKKRRITVDTLGTAIMCLFLGPLMLFLGGVLTLLEIIDWFDYNSDKVIFQVPKKRDLEAEIATLKKEVEELTK